MRFPSTLSRWHSIRFPWTQFHRRPSDRAYESPVLGSPVGSCTSHTERPFRAAPSHASRPRSRWGWHPPGSGGRTPPSELPLPDAPSSLFTRPTAPDLPSAGPAPSLTHLMLPDPPPFHAGFLGIATPAGLRPSVIPPHLGPLSSTGITRRLRSYGPLRHPPGPVCPSRGSGCRVHGTNTASRVATSPLFRACRRHYPGGNEPVFLSLSARPVSGLPLKSGESASATLISRPAQRSLHVPARVVAEPPANLASPLAVSPFPASCPFRVSHIGRSPYQRASAHIVTFMTRAGCYQLERRVAGRDSHPPGKRAFLRHTVSCHYWRVKTTWRVDSHSPTAAIHTATTAYPLVRRCLAAPRLD